MLRAGSELTVSNTNQTLADGADREKANVRLAVWLEVSAQRIVTEYEPAVVDDPEIRPEDDMDMPAGKAPVVTAHV
jgi:hypothetical protein